MTRNRILFTLLLSFATQFLLAQPTSLDYYLPKGVTYDSKIPTPKDVLGYEVGERHVTHDQLVYYMKAVAAASDRVTVQEYARTYEQRPLLLLTVTSPENHGKIEEIKQQRAAITDPSKVGSLNPEEEKLVVWLAYSVHGNEASGANSSLLTAYHLAAAQGEEIEKALAQTVFLVDPAINPDGVQRFSTWVNMHRSEHLVTDPQSREFHERWPNGRTNHYWFDLNRDWLPLQHPESQGRIKLFQEWKPNILTDHHEMGSNSTFFFQPGVQTRFNPLTPSINQELTIKIGNYHAKALDNIGSSYFTKEGFDDFYYGKGSTYPDVQGGVGILFEQGSSRGHAQSTIHGTLGFWFAVRNQFTATLSTIEASQALKTDLQKYQFDFYAEASERAGKDAVKGYIFGDKYDAAKTFHLVEMLSRHGIKTYELAKNTTAGGKSFEEGKAYIVPLDQPQYSLAKAIFKTQTSFRDSLFYDISTWTMPLAFNLPYAELNGKALDQSLLGEVMTKPAFPKGKMVGGNSSVGYVFEWDGYYAPRALYRLKKAGIKVKVATKPATYKLMDGSVKEFTYGAVVIPVGMQSDRGKVERLVSTVAEKDGLEVFGISTGLASSGIDVGSNSFEMVKKPKVMMLGGDGVSPYEAGEVWHLMDQRYEIPVTIVEQNDFSRIDIDKYNVIVMVSGSYKIGAKKLQDWVKEGGTLVALAGATKWVASNGLSHVTFKKKEKGDSTAVKSYAYLSNNRGAQQVGGMIMGATLDITNPLGYGFREGDISVFRRGSNFAIKHENPYATPLIYLDEPLKSGYISEENLELAKGSASILVDKYGSGRIISMVDNPNFRAFWYGTNKLFANAVLFGDIISSSAAR
ncbi:M14 family metallopeptidase [Flammeovirgaceae bacterium SG7u.111]|nr:M14 family metallopeptidase [Flammeovirgaceae bacterium SG7u.132]WPO33824.1 M14 family metallopeptidase [Flammeovirgaceae bacterium SG7u.111]